METIDDFVEEGGIQPHLEPPRGLTGNDLFHSLPLR